jgi:hypothetical protein
MTGAQMIAEQRVQRCAADPKAHNAAQTGELITNVHGQPVR